MSIAECFALLHRVRNYLGPVLGTELVYHADISGWFFSSSKQETRFCFELGQNSFLPHI
jgi:hypothetical protein